MSDGNLLAFLAVAVLVTITPGADMALVTRQALAGGRGAAWLTSLGMCTGLVVWITLSTAGVSALLAASAVAFTALKLAGAAYLVFLGVKAILASRQAESGGAIAGSPTGRPGDGRRAYRQGLLSNLLNPKIGVFYTSLLPQFVTPGDGVALQSMTLGLIHVLMGIVWLAAYGELVVRAGAIFRRPRTRAWLDRVTGSVLIALGIRLAATARR